jgi:hypothetical protein
MQRFLIRYFQLNTKNTINILGERVKGRVWRDCDEHYGGNRTKFSLCRVQIAAQLSFWYRWSAEDKVMENGLLCSSGREKFGREFPVLGHNFDITIGRVVLG